MSLNASMKTLRHPRDLQSKYKQRGSSDVFSFAELLFQIPFVPSAFGTANAMTLYNILESQQ